MHDLGIMLVVRGRLDDAEPLLLEALEGRARVLGESDPATVDTLAWFERLQDSREAAASAPESASEPE